MPANTRHPTLVQPENPNATIWKYIDLPELIYLLQEQKLWFSRLDMLGDPFEGSITKNLLDMVPVRPLPDLPPAAKPNFEKLQRQALSIFVRAQRMSACVSCWTENEDDLMAMWRSYGRSDYSVAIKTTYSTLADKLRDGILLGKVFYTDFSQPIDEEMIKDNLLYYAIRKHSGFSFEREIRAIFIGRNIKQFMEAVSAKMSTQQVLPPESPIYPDESDLAGFPAGEEIAIETKTLIQEIRTNPICPEWWTPVLKTLCKNLGYEIPIVRSSLDSREQDFV
jgi:hypothetical protein